ncbi:MAG: CDP-alcohol phosphatidyltransferase family protein [Bacteroidales bacterium]|nr:CDP-alcohol phosphatidyltransferase family protein [Bacteroidales bacterium]
MDIKQTYKSLDTEEHIDIYFNRPIGYVWALFFRKLHVHPNVVTILSIFLGVAGGIMFYWPDLTHTLIGIFLFVWANHFDSADGQLARMTGQKTRWGRILDGMAGDFWFIAVYAAISFRLMPTWGIWIWVVCFVSGVFFHGYQTTLSDYYRNIHLYFLKGKAGSELDSSDQQKTFFDTLSWKNDFFWKLFIAGYTRYTHNQERMTPWFQKFYRLVRQRYGDEIPQSLREEFRAASLPLMKYANILTFNIRAFALYISMLVGEPWLYPMFEMVVMTTLFVYTRHRHERMSKMFYEKYLTA